MSTNDVPGANPKNADVLAMGCWAEHSDGSLILVEAVEAGKVVYSIFDTAQDPPVEYRDAMDEFAFERQFTWDPNAPTVPKNIKWTWHDKTPFPWDRVMKEFPAGQKNVSADDTMTAAQRVAESLKLRAEKVTDRQIQRPTAQRPARGILGRLHAAIEAFTE